jgi:hypothetical protein
MLKTIIPTITLIKRGVGFLRPSRQIYLKGLNKFSERIRKTLRQFSIYHLGGHKSSVNLSYFAEEFPRISAALKAKGINDIVFVLSDHSTAVNEYSLQVMAEKLVKHAVRELATTGIPQEKRSGWFYGENLYNAALSCCLTISPLPKNNVRAEIAIYTFMKLAISGKKYQG